MRLIRQFCILLFFMLLVISADAQTTGEGPKYTDSALGFELTLPKDWYIADAEELEVFKEKAWSDLTLGTTRNSALGFSTMKQPNEELTSLMVAKSTKDFSLKDSNNKLANDVAIRQIGGRDFAEFDLIVTSSLGKQNVKVMIVNFKGYSLTFALTYWNDSDDLNLMVSAIETTRFLP